MRFRGALEIKLCKAHNFERSLHKHENNILIAGITAPV